MLLQPGEQKEKSSLWKLGHKQGKISTCVGCGDAKEWAGSPRPGCGAVGRPGTAGQQGQSEPTLRTAVPLPSCVRESR